MMKKMFLVILFGFLFQNNACSEEKVAEKKVENTTTISIGANNENYLALMPKEINALFYINVKELQNTPFGQEWHAEIKNKMRDEDDEDYRDFIEQTGVDPEKDIDEIWLGGLTAEDEDFGGLIASGNFDKKRIKKYLDNKNHHKMEEVRYKGHDIYVSFKGRNENEFAFLNSQAIVAGSRGWVKAVLDQLDSSSGSILDDPEMVVEIEKIRHGNQLWGILNLSETSGKWAEDLKKKSSFRGTDSIKNIQSVVFFTQIDKKANMHIRGNFTTAEEAKLLAETVTGLKAMAKLMMYDDREAIDMINEIKINTEGIVLEIYAEFDKRFIEKIKEKREIFSKSPVKML